MTPEQRERYNAARRVAHEPRDCPQCHVRFKPTRVNQPTCGKPECVAVHRRECKQANREWHRARKRRRLAENCRTDSAENALHAVSHAL